MPLRLRVSVVRRGVQRFAYAFTVDLAELPQQLLRSLVEQLWQHQPHLDHEIAAAAFAGRNATFAQPEPLTRLRPWRHAEPCAAVGCRDVDACTERRFVNRD